MEVYQLAEASKVLKEKIEKNHFALEYFIDPLTGLLNMSCFLELAEERIKNIQESSGIPAILSFNLSGLKVFNSKYGMDAGNELLCAFADVLIEYFDEVNCSRFSEDHFYVITEMEGLPERLNSLFIKVKGINGGKSLPVRVGIYNKFEKNTPVSIACDRARIACDYKRSAYVSMSILFDESMEKALLDRAYVISKLDKALENGYIKVHYQPQIRLLDNKLCGVEALARWEDPEYGNLSPAVFIPILEENKLTYKLDKYIIKSVAKDIVHAYNMGWTPVPASFNLSRTDFISMDPSYELEKIVTEYGLPKYMFRLEITESTVMEDPEGLRDQIKKFHETGFDVLMDDFGSAYSSLNTLRDFEFDEIKIDRCFLINFNEKSKKIIESMILMAKKLGIHALTEGVETAEQVEFLKRVGCESIQGYYYGKPVNYEKIEKMISNRELIREDYEEKVFFETVGLVNVINDNAFALVLYNGRKFKLYYSNEKFKTMLCAKGDTEENVIERVANSATSDTSRKIRQNADRAIMSGRDEEVTVVSDNRFYRIVFRDIAGYTEGRMFKVNLYDITFEDQNGTKEQMENVLRNLVSVFSGVYYIDYDEDSIRNVIADKRFDKMPAVTEKLSEFVNKLLHGNIVYPTDKSRFMKAFDNAYIRAKMQKINRGSYSELYRLKTVTEEYVWTELLFIALPGWNERKLLLSFRVLEPGEKDAFIEEARRIAGFYGTFGETDVKIDDRDFDSYILNSFMEMTELKFFWKDSERRFFGVSKAFKDYFGLKSAELIYGKTNEEIGWHIDDLKFEADEERVLQKGEIIKNSRGKILVNGIERNIVTTKYPIIKEGEIVGLVGYFIDSDTVISSNEKIDNALFVDVNLGIMNIRGLFLMLQSYDDNLRRSNKNYGIALIEISNYAYIYVKYGKKLADKLVRYVIKCIGRSFRKTAVIAQTKSGCFAVCDKEYSKQQMIDMAELCITKIEMSMELDVLDMDISVNYGAAMGDERDSVQNVFSLALYRLSQRRNLADGGDQAEKVVEEVLPDIYHDLPLPYAIVRPYIEEGAVEANDIEYLFVNQKYSDMCGISREKLIGKTYRSSFLETEIDWVTYVKRATNGETIRGRGYGGALGHWLDFIMAPTAIPGMCYVVFWPIDDSKKEKDLLTRDHATDNAVIRIARYLNGIRDYELSINRALSEIGRSVHSTRIHIIDTDRNILFEWCASGIQGITETERLKIDFDALFENLNTSSSIVIDDHQNKHFIYSADGEQIFYEDIYNILAAPLLDNGKVVAALFVENFPKEEAVDTRQLVEDASYFISAKMMNNMLMKKLDILSTRDTLTGLMNRQGLRNEIKKLVDYYPEFSYTLVVLDIDDFKLVNDAYGHIVGDNVLCIFADNLRETFTENAIIARTGGDEFCVLLKDKRADDIEELVEDLSNMKHFFMVENEEVKFTISIGYADVPGLADDLTNLVAEADAALYEVKAKNKGGYKKYTPQIKLNSRSQLAFNMETMTENLPSSIIVYRAEENRRILYANKNFLRLFGCSDLEEFIDVTDGTFNNVVFKEDILRVTEEFEKKDAGCGCYSGKADYRIVTRDGTIREVECRSRTVENNFYGRIIYMLLCRKGS